MGFGGHARKWTDTQPAAAVSREAWLRRHSHPQGDAFAKLPEGTVKSLLKPENKKI